MSASIRIHKDPEFIEEQTVTKNGYTYRLCCQECWGYVNIFPEKDESGKDREITVVKHPGSPEYGLKNPERGAYQIKGGTTYVHAPGRFYVFTQELKSRIPMLHRITGSYGSDLHWWAVASELLCEVRLAQILHMEKYGNSKESEDQILETIEELANALISLGSKSVLITNR